MVPCISCLNLPNPPWRLAWVIGSINRLRFETAVHRGLHAGTGSLVLIPNVTNLHLCCPNACSAGLDLQPGAQYP